MQKVILAATFLFVVAASNAQTAVPYVTSADRFGVFHDGQFEELEPRRPQAIFPNGDRLAYLSAEGELRLWADGHVITLQHGETVDVHTTRGMLAWKQGDLLRVATDNGATTVCRQTGNFSVQDSLVAFHNVIDHTLSVYWRGRSFPVADVLLVDDAPQWKAGSNTLLFFNHAEGKIYLVYRGNTEVLCRGQDYARISPGGDVVAYMDDSDDTFRVFDQEERIDLEPLEPQSFQAGLGQVGYVTNGGALRLYQDHQVYSLSGTAPSTYQVQDSVILWVEDGMLRTFNNGQVVTIERFVPEKWSVSGAMVAYQDLNRELRIWYRGQRIVVTKEPGVQQFELVGDAVVWRSNSGTTKVWWHGKTYEHY